jgi:hypothetical protein
VSRSLGRALRLLRTLEEGRLVHRGTSYRYHLGAGPFALSSRGLGQRPVRAAAARHLATLNREIGHTVHLAAHEGGEVVYIDEYDSCHTVAAVSVSVPDVVLGYEQVLGLPPALLATTAAISADCGWRAEPAPDDDRPRPRADPR